MNIKLIYTLITIIIIFLLSSTGNTEYRSDIINSLRPTESDIPSGFVYGRVPQFYQRVLKNNPWMMDNAAIQKLAKNIYPDGDFRKIANIHVSIIADRKTPFGDDIVCYIILYKDRKSAEGEIGKISDFAKYNNDRAIVLSKENLVVFLHVDDIENFHHIRAMAEKMEERLAHLDSSSNMAAVAK